MFFICNAQYKYLKCGWCKKGTEFFILIVYIAIVASGYWTGPYRIRASKVVRMRNKITGFFYKIKRVINIWNLITKVLG